MQQEQSEQFLGSFFLPPQQSTPKQKLSPQPPPPSEKQAFAHHFFSDAESQQQTSSLDDQYVRRRRQTNSSSSSSSSHTKQPFPLPPPPPTASLLDTSPHLPPQPPVSETTSPSHSSTHSSNWITVFGFPLNANAAILDYFQQLGQITQYSNATGNWLHLHYRTRLQAEKALTLNGDRILNNVMIGVKKCDHPESGIVSHSPSYVEENQSRVRLRELEVNPEELDIMGAPRRRDSVCSRIMRFLFNV